VVVKGVAPPSGQRRRRASSGKPAVSSIPPTREAANRWPGHNWRSLPMTT